MSAVNEHPDPEVSDRAEANGTATGVDGSSGAGRREPRGRRRARSGRPGDTEQRPRATFGQLLPYLLESPGLMGGIVAISIVGAVFSLAQPLLVGVLIGQVEAGTLAQWLLWALVGVVIIGALLQGFQHYLLQRTGESIVRTTRRKLVAKLLRLPITEFDARRTGDLVSRVGSDTTLLRAVLTQGLVEAVGGLLTFVGAVVAMVILDLVLFGVTVGVVVAAVAAVVLLSGRIRTASAAAQAKVGELTSAVERSISSVRTIRASGATEREERLVADDIEGAYRRGLDVASASALIVPVSGVAMQGALIAVLGLGGLRVAAGDLSIASLIAFIMFLFMMIMPLGQFIGAIAAVNSALGALGRIQEIIDLPEEGHDDRDHGPVVEVRGAANVEDRPDAPALAFDRVSFRYPDTVVRARTARARAAARLDRFATGRRRGGAMSLGGDDSGLDELFRADDEAAAPASPLVLDDVSFEVPRGTRVALVGPSGAGKSTSLALIERFYDPTEGSIRLGGIDLRNIDRADLRRQIGYVQQDAPVLAGTLAENLRLGRPDASDDECEAVLREVNLGGVLDRSPERLAAAVGEAGVMLSGGERQRLAIARTLLAASPILLLDESTSSLDGANERAMRDAIDRVAEGRSLIVIAHRLSTVVDSDEIVVLDRGRVVGRGTHEQLVESTPLYRELAQHQLLVPAER
ncbi:ABC transporter [Pseudoclavibacter endophyticus]|uniref:ABC transporter ATP-binding protein n=1 Tax=Pseudoclavibacter endophyticus TaxID=1778590 RepID=A0A6H9WKY1_9MICO|nr:ABC transporter ATP-binding protein [Pseudoclavibacter endophyticus]KAB1648162.1 ABC transporter ATP-binding protein [Pseudoclavibacter endophyticus]GGA70237.1 ABC transporter [Pseudoclavibacter endophyticus]